jgi:hypothetical protein
MLNAQCSMLIAHSPPANPTLPYLPPSLTVFSPPRRRHSLDNEEPPPPTHSLPLTPTHSLPSLLDSSVSVSARPLTGPFESLILDSQLSALRPHNHQRLFAQTSLIHNAHLSICLLSLTSSTSIRARPCLSFNCNARFTSINSAKEEIFSSQSIKSSGTSTPIIYLVEVLCLPGEFHHSCASMTCFLQYLAPSK